MKIIHNNQVLKIDYFIRHGNQETILYLHGLGCSKDDFQKATQVDELQSHTLVAFDLPGCGGSTYPEATIFLTTIILRNFIMLFQIL